jgi:hypothetical protein
MTTTNVDSAVGPDRVNLNFANIAKEKFSFLCDIGFAIIESLPTIVRYRKGDVQVDVYHGRRSYEIGLGIAWLDVRYELPDFIAVADLQAANDYYTPMASTREGVIEGLTRLAELAKRYCGLALQGDPIFFAKATEAYKSRREKYWLEMNARQLRPQAEAAFRLGKYREAAELYKQIRPLLSSAELKKLAVAEERSRES